MTETKIGTEGSATPVGDWLRRRYPPNPGATHYLGTGDDPGCCAGPHPACTYDAGFREGARVQREADAQLAEQYRAIYPLSPPSPSVTVNGEPVPVTLGNTVVWPDGMPPVALFAGRLRERAPVLGQGETE